MRLETTCPWIWSDTSLPQHMQKNTKTHQKHLSSPKHSPPITGTGNPANSQTDSGCSCQTDHQPLLQVIFPRMDITSFIMTLFSADRLLCAKLHGFRHFQMTTFLKGAGHRNIYRLA